MHVRLKWDFTTDSWNVSLTRTCLLSPGIRIKMSTDKTFNCKDVIHYGRVISNLIHSGGCQAPSQAAMRTMISWSESSVMTPVIHTSQVPSRSSHDPLGAARELEYVGFKFKFPNRLIITHKFVGGAAGGGGGFASAKLRIWTQWSRPLPWNLKAAQAVCTTVIQILLSWHLFSISDSDSESGPILHCDNHDTNPTPGQLEFNVESLTGVTPWCGVWRYVLRTGMYWYVPTSSCSLVVPVYVPVSYDDHDVLWQIFAADDVSHGHGTSSHLESVEVGSWFWHIPGIFHISDH